MASQRERVLQEALALPEDERIEMVAALLESVETQIDEGGPDAHAVSSAKARRRLQEIRSGVVKPVSMEEAERVLCDPSLGTVEGLEDALPERVPITAEVLADARANGTHLDLALKLYAEAAELMLSCSAAIVVGDSAPPLEPPHLQRDHAIAAALLARLGKFMLAVLHLGRTGAFGEVVLALNRCILETIINIRYLCQETSSERYDRFVRDGLSPERELHDKVQANIVERGSRLPIEARLLAGVQRVFEAAEIPLEAVKPRERSVDYASRLRALGLEDSYVFVQSMPSAAVHGTWLDLHHHHIKLQDGGGFSVRYERRPMDVRLLCPVIVVAGTAAHDFVARHLGATADTDLLADAILDIQERAAAVDESHETWLSS